MTTIRITKKRLRHSLLPSLAVLSLLSALAVFAPCAFALEANTADTEATDARIANGPESNQGPSRQASPLEATIETVATENDNLGAAEGKGAAPEPEPVKRYEHLTGSEATGEETLQPNLWTFEFIDGTMTALNNGKPSAYDGWAQASDGSWYWFSNKAEASTSQWISYSGHWYWLDETGKNLTGTFSTPNDGKMWHATSSGSLVQGVDWVISEGSWYFLASDGSLRTKWVEAGSWYWLDPNTGAMQTGWLNLDNAWYHLGDQGAMQTGWEYIGGNWYLFKSSGAMERDWNFYKGSWYWCDSDGAMRTWWTNIHDSWYFFDSNGAMQCGWLQLDSTWYKLSEDGVMQTGWQYDRGSWYWLDPTNGDMRTGWLQVDDDWFYLRSNGKMATGWLPIDNKLYYFNASGVWTENGDPMTQKAQWYSSATNWLIMVDVANNYMGIYYGSYGNWEPQWFWAVSTGAPETPTVIGEFTIGSKGYSFGDGFTCYYYSQIYGDYLIHSEPYYSGTFDLMDDRLGVHITHGCVRLSMGNSKWVYDNIPYRTKVVTYW